MNKEKKNTVLIVDDEHVNLKILTHILENEYTIYTAQDGISAIKKAMEVSPDLILLDIVMPEADGYEALTMLKKLKETQNIPVIYISGLDHTGEEEKGLALGAVDYITKPFSSKILRLRVRHQIQIINQMRTIDQLKKDEPQETEQSA
ncbi:MAG: response regulator [Treponema sp.]|jgi:PleD family two-component response regulator|nr:response regulator [Treponema sp.]